VSRALGGAVGLTVALVLGEAALPHGGHAPLGAFAAMGVGGGLLLGVGAKALGAWLQRPVSAADDDRWEDAP
jgi:hypothetical protein